jgi:hypothetical protein
MAESPNVAGLERKVEKTMASPPPEERPPIALPLEGPALLESPPENGAGEPSAGEPEAAQAPGQVVVERPAEKEMPAGPSR